VTSIKVGDGTGHAYLARVDSLNRLAIYGPAEHQVKAAAKFGDGYGFGMNDIAVPANTSIAVIYAKFDDPLRNFHLNGILGAWNGGSTTYNKPLSMMMWVGVPAPTANHVAVPFGNMSLASANVALATSYVWTGVGSGMTIAAGGQAANRAFFAQGTTEVAYNGSMIFPRGVAISVVLSAPEAGIASIFFGGWFE
jgi:hypothetical protein